MSLYVGRYVDPNTMAPGREYAVLDPDALTRHAVCVGMTGSGKTGLCVALLEELAMAGVPLVIIDPKGDMANLALAFRDHRPEDFAPWIDPAEAQRAGLTVEQHAGRVADRWRAGLAEWQVGRDRIDALTERAKVTIYTPGSTSGVPVDVLGSLAAPPEGLLDDEEGLIELVTGTVSALLALIGVQADPLTDPAHLVLSRVVETAWREREPLDLATLILRLVDPPFDKIGVFPLERFLAREQRMKLAMQLNGLAASPAFAAWAQGAPLDPARLLTPQGGRAPVSVFSLAHLDEPRRMFFVAQLLTRIVAWSRRQPGTSSLRGFVYFDEVYGYLPPHPRDPPTKRPVLTLMKQARAVGIGTMLVTQNPVDVDYAALSNAGLWLVGRLQTQQDRDKVVDGLAGAGAGADRAVLGEWIGRLPSRAFVVREAGRPEPRVLHSRQVITYLRGPMTKREIERLTPDAAPAAPAAPTGLATPRVDEAAPEGFLPAPPPAPQGYAYGYLDPAAAHSARLVGFFESALEPRRADERVVWRPAIYARLALRFDEGREFVLQRDEHRLFFPTDGEPVEPELREGDVLLAPLGPGWFAPLPSDLDEARELKRFEQRVIEQVLTGEVEHLYRHRELRMDSRAGETREAFAERVRAAADDRADEQIAALKDDVERAVKRLQDKRDKLARDVERQKAAARDRQMQEVVAVGESLLGVFFGRRRTTTAVSRAMSRRGQTNAANQRVERVEDEITALEREEYELEVKTGDQIEAIQREWRDKTREIEAMEVRLERSDVKVSELTILWVPVSRAI